MSCSEKGHSVNRNSCSGKEAISVRKEISRSIGSHKLGRKPSLFGKKSLGQWRLTFNGVRKAIASMIHNAMSSLQLSEKKNSVTTRTVLALRKALSAQGHSIYPSSKNENVCRPTAGEKNT